MNSFLLLSVFYLLTTLLLIGEGTSSRETFTYYYRPLNPTAWKHFNWTSITTLAISNPLESFQPPSVEDSELISTAKHQGVRVVGMVSFQNPLIPQNTWTETTRSKWVAQVVAMVTINNLDGIQVDVEYGDWSWVGGWYGSELVSLIASLRQSLPSSAQLTMAINVFSDMTFDLSGHTPMYPLLDLAKSSDYFIFMGYDLQCDVACPPRLGNSNTTLLEHQMSVFIDKWGLDAGQIILALPWYVYGYPCTWETPVDGEWCHLNTACACQGEWQMSFSLVPSHGSHDKVFWDAVADEDFLNYMKDGVWHQVWFEVAKTLQSKYALINKWGMRGAAVWGAEKLTYEPMMQDTVEMWDQFASVLKF